jgi:hypothetical protein
LKDFSLESLTPSSEKTAISAKLSSSQIHSLQTVREVTITSSPLEVISYLATVTHAAPCGRTAHFGESEAREISREPSDTGAVCSSSSSSFISSSSVASSSATTRFLT